MEVFGANVLIMSSSSAKTIYAGYFGPISRITTMTEPIWGSTKKHRRDDRFQIDLPHLLDSLSCLESAGYTTDTNGARRHEFFNNLYDRDERNLRTPIWVNVIMIVRTTAKLAKQVGVSSLNATPLAENPFTDWTCRVFSVGDRESLMLITNTASLYSLLAPAKGLENLEEFGYGLIHYIERHLLIDGFEDVFREHVVPELKTMLLAKTLNRSVTGSMTDMVKLSGHMLFEDGDSLEQVAGKLNKTPFGALDYNYPRDRFAELKM